jgi:hypothetical protein
METSDTPASNVMSATNRATFFLYGTVMTIHAVTGTGNARRRRPGDGAGQDAAAGENQ